MSSSLGAHPQALALLAAAKERPGDDAPRLALADWLDEHGDAARAELIRLQCRLAARPPRPQAARRRALARAQALIERHGGAWLGPLWGRWPRPPRWRRGLLCVNLPPGARLAEAGEALPWIDAAVFAVTGESALRLACEGLAAGGLNGACLDLRRPLAERRLLARLAEVPESCALRGLAFGWPPGLLRRPPGGRSAPAVSRELLRRLLTELPVGRHLSHLSSSPAWSPAQVALVRSLGAGASAGPFCP